MSYKKSCDCRFQHGESIAGTNRFILTTKRENNSIVATLTFYPQPTCMKCDKPWTREEDAAPIQNAATCDAP